jgi:hypothetical protein
MRKFIKQTDTQKDACFAAAKAEYKRQVHNVYNSTKDKNQLANSARKRHDLLDRLYQLELMLQQRNLQLDREAREEIALDKAEAAGATL